MKVPLPKEKNEYLELLGLKNILEFPNYEEIQKRLLELEFHNTNIEELYDIKHFIIE